MQKGKPIAPPIMPNGNNPTIFNIDELSYYLGFTVNQIKELVELDSIPFYMNDGKPYFVEAEIRVWGQYYIDILNGIREKIKNERNT